MIKKVRVEYLVPGVYIEDFNCDWKGSNLYVEPGFIKNDNIIEILKSWGIDEVYIDIEKGLDVGGRKRTKPKAGPGARSAATQPIHTTRPEVPLKEELQSAREITRDAVRVVDEANRQVMEGKVPDVRQTYELANRMNDSLHRNRDALLLLSRIRSKDEYTLRHSVSVSSLVLNLCNYRQVSEYQTLDLAVGALFHDIGKASIPLTVLNKPARLTDEEFRLIQRHAEFSVNLLAKAKGLPLECYDIALHHHERFDGSGYPHGLKGAQISFGAKMTAVCDVFDAITSERCYKSGMDTVLGLRKIYEGSGTHFCKEIARDFIQSVGMYPVGTCVVLEDGRSGVVVGSTEDLMRPVVQVVYDERKQERIRPQQVDLAQIGGNIASYGEPARLGTTSKVLLEKILSALS